MNVSSGSVAVVRNLKSGPGPAALAGAAKPRPSNTRPDNKNPVFRKQPPNIRISVSNLLVIGRASGCKVHPVYRRAARRSPEWTRPVTFDMKGRRASKPGTPRHVGSGAQLRRKLNNIN